MAFLEGLGRFVLFEGIFLLFVALLFLYLSYFGEKSAQRIVVIYNSIIQKFYDQGRELRMVGKPYSPAWDSVPKGTFTKSLAPYLEEARRRGYNDADKSATLK